MVNRKTVSALTAAALLACAVPVRSMASALMLPGASLVIAQSTPAFPVPDSVAVGTEVAISSSSDNMNAISEALGAEFESEYEGSKVSIETKDANAAIQDVLNGNADLAAISRPLTAEEQAKGLIAQPVRREKIAIVVSKDNSFAQSITGSQFAQIFRGEIKDWSAVGGDAGPIKLIDRPTASETRLALSPYPVFTTAPFTATADATTLESDTTDALVKAIGPDGISYMLVGELEGQSELKALQLHKTLPDNPKYPFSQPYSFVYAEGESSAVSAFLGYATGNPGQAAVNNADVSGVGLIPDAGNGTATASAETLAAGGTASPDSTTDADGSMPDSDTVDVTETPPDAASESEADGTTTEADSVMVAGLDGELGTADDIDIVGPDGVLGSADDIRGIGPDGELGTADDIDLAGPDGVPGTADDVSLAGPDGEIGTADDVTFAGTVAAEGATPAPSVGIGEGSGLGNLAAKGRWWWLLLPLAGLGLLIWAAGRRGSEEDAGYVANADGDDRIRTAVGGDIPSGNISRPEMGGIDANLPGSTQKLGIGSMGKVAAGSTAAIGGIASAGAGVVGRMKNRAGNVATGGINSIKGGVDSVKGSIDGGVAGFKSNVQGGVDNVGGGVDGIQSSVQGGVDSAKSNLQDGVDGIKGNVQGDMDGIKGKAQGGIDKIRGAGAASLGAGAAGLGAAGAGLSDLRNKAKGSVDGLKGKAQDGIDGVKGSVQGSVDALKGKAQDGVDSVGRTAGDAQGSGESWLDRAKQRINEATDQAKNTASDIKDDVTKNN